MAGTKMGVVGCGGRMGGVVGAEICATEKTPAAGGRGGAGSSEAPGSGYVNQDIGELAGIGRIGIPIGENVERLMRDSDVVLEFTSPAATAEHAQLPPGPACRTSRTRRRSRHGDGDRHYRVVASAGRAGAACGAPNSNRLGAKY